MPKLVDPDRKRAEFVAASWDVISSHGLKAATLRRVAAEAGCTTGSLTHYFADRRSLLIGSLRLAHYQAGRRMLEAAQRSASPAERLEAVLLEALPLDEPRLREWRVWLAFWGESMNDAELATENDRRYEEWRALLQDAVAPLVKKGNRTQRTRETRREVDTLIALVDGLGLAVARISRDDGALAAKRRESVATLERHLTKFDTD